MNKKISTPIAIGIIFILSVIVGLFTITQLLKMKIELKMTQELVIPDKEQAEEAKKEVIDSKIVHVSFIPKFNKNIGLEELTFSDLEGKEIIKIVGDENGEIKGLDFEKNKDEAFFVTREDLLVSPYAIESPNGIFYFFLADSGNCGNAGCWWVLYKYNSENKQFSNISAGSMWFSEGMLREGYSVLISTIPGHINEIDDNYYFSSNKENVVIIYSLYTGCCSGKNNITIINLKESTISYIAFPEDKNCDMHRITFVKWLNENSLEVLLNETFCNDNNEWIRKYNYSLLTKKAELIEEKASPVPNG